MPATPTWKPGERGQAHELAERSGIPYPVALRVIRGEATLDQVLRQLLRQDTLRNLVARGLPSTLAGQVAMGHLGEDKAWETLRAMQHPGYAPDRSILVDAARTGQPLLLNLFGGSSLRGSVTQVEKYEVLLGAGGAAEPRRVPKHEVKWAAGADVIDRLPSDLGVDPAIAARGLGASRLMQDRLRLPRQLVLELLDRARPLRAVARDGGLLIGRLRWASRYELALDLAPRGSEPIEIVVFLHALFRLEDAASGEVIASAGESTPAAATGASAPAPGSRKTGKAAAPGKKLPPGKKPAAAKGKAQGTPGARPKASSGNRADAPEPGSAPPDGRKGPSSREKGKAPAGRGGAGPRPGKAGSGKPSAGGKKGGKRR